MNYDLIPIELTKLDQWVLWKRLFEDDEWKKIPFQTRGIDNHPNTLGVELHARARSNNPQTWTTFEAVIQKIQNSNGLYDGIGFMFCADDPYCFIDLDHCIDEAGKIDAKNQRIIDTIDSYTEISQSGTGIHVIVKAKHPEGYRNHVGHYEIYDKGRYAVMTGEVYTFNFDIQERQEQVNKICDEIFRPEPKQSQPAGHPTTINLSDQEIITKASNATNGAKFKALFNGDTSGYPSSSEADLALCDLIAFYTQSYDQILSIVKQSALYDDKWERADYQKRTIDKAISGLTATYQSSQGSGTVNNSTEKKEVKQADKPKEKKSPYFDGNTFIPKWLADKLMSEHDFICADSVIYEYAQGYYKALTDDVIESFCYKKLGDEARTNRANEAINYIKAMKRIEPDILNTHKEVINFQNCVYNWKTGAISEHSKELFSTVRIPVKLDTEAQSETVTDWLYSTLRDPELITLALELFGYCLTTDVTMTKAFMLVGSGSNGKSTFLTVLEKFIGKDNVCKIPLQELADHRFKRAELFGKLVNLFADLDSKALESTSYFKTIVSGDSIDAERKNQNPFFFRPFAKLVYSANEIPRSRDRSYAYYRRWCIIPFNQKFEGANENKDLADQLTRPENLSALLNCALKELTNVYKRQAFSNPQATIEAITEYEKQNDPVKAFIDECCEFDQYSRIERGELYNAFNRFCEDSGYRTVTNRHFYQRLRIFREIKEIRTPHNRMFEGVKLIDTLL